MNLQQTLCTVTNLPINECRTLDSLITAYRDGSLEYDLMYMVESDLENLSDKTLSKMCLDHKTNAIKLRNLIEDYIEKYKLEDIF